MSDAGAVVCNAGPLIALGKLNRLHLLADLYDEVLMPEAVYDEVVRQGGARGEPDARAVRLFWQRQKWPLVVVTPDMLATVQTSVVLGRGEVAVLALANTAAQSTVLMDDALARAEARRMGLSVRGTLGILVQAYRSRLLSLVQVKQLMAEIAARPDIWISAQLCMEILTRLRNPSNSES